MQIALNERIKILVDRLNMSAAEFSRATSIEQGTLSRIILGHSIPRFDQIEKIVSAFPDISFEFLLTGNGNPFASNEPKETELTICNERLAALRREIDLLNELLNLYRGGNKAAANNESGS